MPGISKHQNLFGLGLLVLFLSGCTTIGTVAPSVSLGSNGASYYVLGIAPEKTRAMVVEGSVYNGEFERTHVPFTKFTMNTPQDGFLVGESTSGKPLALLRVFDESGWPDVAFGPCKTGAKVLTFAPQPGTVVYITNVRFVPGARGLSPIYASDLEAAREFMKSHYPKLADKLQQGSFELVTSAEDCPPSLAG